MSRQPFSYIEPLYRPPSEASSLILQVTNGCSWNRCTFCEMYTAPQKKFGVRPDAEVEQDLQAAAAYAGRIRRVFLADGDAMALSVRRLVSILEMIQRHLPGVERVSAYCLPRNLKGKSLQELELLRSMGLSLLYVGAESGDDEVLERVNKGETHGSTRDALLLAGEAGIKRSVMILNGLGGSQLSRQHAIQSALLANATQPEYLSTLVVSFPLGETRFRKGFPDYIPLQQGELFEEMELLIGQLELQNTVFRSDHASNYLVLKGRLGRDKQRLLQEVRQAMANPAQAGLRQEWQRGL
ncbi:radical SAM protein [Aestuariirhabdus litorea]|uniref:Radical SAM protein n=1 Tax=Aestuariirhabdus litorea TaxID=2528527 RepID=A0A3P3VST7_9GAMM|nr:radical SAM protein [Aestuariirhabdus litorea]RRJ84756.1 radical SAM protein [Aestuariirhabdus litorea]RWW97981.1 radical SAM protein [Endozoicomonadaceae bacterium GTF-13]